MVEKSCEVFFMEQQGKKKNKGCLIAIGCMLAVVALVLGLAVSAYNSILNKIPRVDPDNEITLSEEEIQAIERETDPAGEIPEDATIVEEEMTMPPEEAVLIENEDHIINILLIGQDRRPGEGRQRSDSMILCTINTQEKTLVMTSFLRDLYVGIPDWNGRSYMDNRLNSCYAFGGMGMLDLALKQNFGIQVDHNIEVDFSGFKDIIELFGGVSIYLTQAEAEYMGGGLTEGVNYLTPEQALTYSRIRYLDSDFGRTNRQRKVLTAMLNSVKDLSYDQLTNLVNNILPMITTDMSNSDITGYMMEILPILSELQVTTQHVPASGTYSSVYIRGMAVLVPDFKANIAILKDTLS